MTKDLEYLKKSFDYLTSGKADKKEIDELKERIKLEIEPKAEIHEVQTAINAVQKDIVAWTNDLWEELISVLKDLDSKVNHKINIADIEEILKEKLDTDAFTEAM